MTVSSGFFNSVNHDRLYDAEQLSSIFDGVIVDGVYENVGEAFNVTAYPDAYNTVLVGTGRAWFDHTWTLNDSRFSITLDPPNEMLGRIDAIVIDVNKERDTRKNSIIYLKGDEVTPDFPPTLINTENHHQYPIAYITRHAEQNGPISQSDIEITVGTGACPIATGVLEAQNLENLMQQLDAEFNEWWEGIKDLLDENTATKLQNQIDEINEKLNGDTSLVGLLEKPIAEAFMSGDYGLNVSSYSCQMTEPEYELQNMISFLPNGEVCSINISPEVGEYALKYFININIVTPDGISHPQTITVDQGAMSQQTNHWTGGSGPYDRSGLMYYSTAALIYKNIESYPAIFVYLATKIDIYSDNIVSKIITVKISSSRTVSVDYSDGISPTQPFPGSLTNEHHTQLRVSWTPNSVKFNNGFTALPILFSLDQVYTEEDTYTQPAACVTMANSDNVMTQSSWSSMVEYNNILGLLGNKELSNIIWVNNSIDETEAICYLSEKVDSSNPDKNVDTKARVIFDSETLTFSAVDNAADSYPLPSSYPYDVKYGTETYSLSEKNGVMKTEISVGGSTTPSEVKKSNYFLGATNLCEALPEGSFIAANENDRLYGIASGGEQVAIGTNGGAAILKTKKSVSNSIDINKVVLWAKGYITTEDYTAYLMINGTTNRVLSYGHRDGLDSKSAFVVKISKEV